MNKETWYHISWGRRVGDSLVKATSKEEAEERADQGKDVSYTEDYDDDSNIIDIREIDEDVARELDESLADES